MNIAPLLRNSSTFVLFIAPPAWGKTHLILKLGQELDKTFFFISPLRALAEEFSLKCQPYFKTLVLRTQKEWCLENLKNYKIVICTPELMNQNLISYIESKKDSILLIYDEFHLFYKWGETFREQMLTCLEDLGSTDASILALSATMNFRVLQKYRESFQLAYESIYEINGGNQMFLREPKQVFYFGFLGRQRFKTLFLFELQKASYTKHSKEVLLCFCQYRQEVDLWVKYCLERGISALGCKGGEVLDFTKKLHKQNEVSVIFATTALSHGVNLPKIKKVFLSYPVKDLDLWLQMSTRAGREGGEFFVYTFDKFKQNSSQRLFSGIWSYFSVQFARLHLLWEML